MAVQPDRPNAFGLLTVAIAGSIITLVVAYLAAAAYNVTVDKQGAEKDQARDLSELHEILETQNQDLAGIEQAMKQVVDDLG